MQTSLRSFLPFFLSFILRLFCTGTLTGCTSHPHPSFTPQPLPASHLTSPPPLFAAPPPFSPPALLYSRRIARSPVCLLRPVILTALLLFSPRPPIVSIPPPPPFSPSPSHLDCLGPFAPLPLQAFILPFILLVFLLSTLSFSSLTKLFFLYILFFVL